MSASVSPDHYYALPVGTRLNEFEIVSVLGSGGFGITYLASDTLLDEAVALKEYLPGELAVRGTDATVRAKTEGERPDFEAGLRAFLEEARLLARFRHPNIVKVRRFFELHGTGYIVLDYEKGETLSRRLSREPMPEAELRALFDGVLSGLEAVHRRAALHRDLKPNNIILREDGTPILIDFGAARDFASRHSRSVTAIAAPGYSPPEQYGVGEQQGPWTDFYALGAIAYRVVTGSAPVDSLRRLRKDPLVPATQATLLPAPGGYSRQLLETIDWMLRIDEADRPQSVDEVRKALDRSTAVTEADCKEATQVINSSAPETAATAGGTTPRAEPSKSSGMWGSILLAVACLTLLAVALVWRRGLTELNLTNMGPAALETGPDIAALPPAPVVASQTGPCGGVTLASLGSRASAPLSLNEECALQAKDVFKECEHCPEMVVVPAGSFTMGSPPNEAGRHSDEGPEHEVTISKAFAVGKFEATFEEWDACVADRGCGGYSPGDEGWGRERRPVINVSWNDAQAYASWLSRKTGKTYRLLTEAEWEYAARGATRTPFWFGSSISTSQANYDGNYAYGGGRKGEYRKKTVPVGSFAANPFGLYEVHGNVWEFVEDCYHDNYSGALSDGAAWTIRDCGSRVRRGGSWLFLPMDLRAAERNFIEQVDRKYVSGGFRLARTLTPSFAPSGDGKKIDSIGNKERVEDAGPQTQDKDLPLKLSKLNDELRARFRINKTLKRGVLITWVRPGSNAWSYRLRAGEVLIELNEKQLGEPSDVTTQVKALKDAGKRTALFVVADWKGVERFVAIPLE